MPSGVAADSRLDPISSCFNLDFPVTYSIYHKIIGATSVVVLHVGICPAELIKGLQNNKLNNL